MAKQSLVIVESPAKAKTIEKYLGKDFRVKASMGHLRDLPKSTLGVDVERDFDPVYQPIKGKEDIIGDLKKSAKSADTVYLATDPDREGEAISWHLKQLLNLPDEKTRRVTFNEITKKVVQESIQRPRDIDQNLVDAQQARRILDRIVGYQLSPLLWKKIRRGLSAGRVQSVATRMVDDREREIEAFQPEEYWTLDAFLRTDDGKKTEFTAHYHGKDGKKVELKSADEVESVVKETKNQAFAVKSVKRTDKQRSPSPPFTTSTLQQDASRKLSMTPRRTMAIAQQLYEGVDIAGEGAVGLITYMRTDSLRISEEAQAAAKTFILSRYGKEYYPAQVRHYKAKANAQDAHEAIRPSSVELTPEQVKGDLTGEQYRLYKLIWSRFLASQMENAVYDSVSVDISAGEHIFRATASGLKFAGYTAVYEEGKDEEKEEKESPLPALREGEALGLKEFRRDQHFTQPPAHYTDATLIRAMEEQGIGRPSTYAPTVSTILDREYVVKEGKYLKITNLGRVVTDLMKQRFSDIADLQFTAHMERKLDSVEEGMTPWKGVLREFYGDFEQSLKDAETALEGTRIKVPDEVSEEICPECGRNLVVKSGRFGRFLACPGYPDCSFTMPLVVVMPGRCPKCGGRIMKRSGVSKKSGKQYNYYCCEHRSAKDEAAKCDFMTWDVPVKDDCPVCGQTMFKRSGRGYKRPYCVNPACSNFLPEDQRGYPKKTADEGGESDGEGTAKKPTEKAAAKKPAAKKTAAKKITAKKPASKKTAAGTAAAKKKAPAKTAKKPVDPAAEAEETAEKKTAMKKAATKKPAAKKTATKKPAAKAAKNPTGKKPVSDEEI
ncbi:MULTISPECIES: type I DNA topoisomerase [unclassified Oscillibacter]|uniref:type I DNA topoisomerase n=1 Tax=unclassified Oscillibacter TaxID=2629304 RepID=UPI0025F1EF08|nr:MULTISPECIES: type I DNA topoisomerase [unclassified Oscillibacter]